MEKLVNEEMMENEVNRPYTCAAWAAIYGIVHLFDESRIYLYKKRNCSHACPACLRGRAESYLPVSGRRPDFHIPCAEHIRRSQAPWHISCPLSSKRSPKARSVYTAVEWNTRPQTVQLVQMYFDYVVGYLSSVWRYTHCFGLTMKTAFYLRLLYSKRDGLLQQGSGAHQAHVLRRPQVI